MVSACWRTDAAAVSPTWNTYTASIGLIFLICVCAVRAFMPDMLFGSTAMKSSVSLFSVVSGTCSTVSCALSCILFAASCMLVGVEGADISRPNGFS